MRRLFRLPVLAALLSVALPAAVQSDQGTDTAGPQVESIGSALVQDIGAAFPACGVASAASVIEIGPGRTSRDPHSDMQRPASGGVAGPAGNCSHRDHGSLFCDATARLARAGIHTSALGTPPPQA